MMTNLSGRPGVSSVLIDSVGTVLAAPADQASRIGKPLDSVPLLSAIAHKALVSGASSGSIGFAAADGSNRLVSFAQIPGTDSRLIVSIDEARVTAAINRDIRTAYLQLGFVCLFVLLGALVGAEKLIIQPIHIMTGMAKRFGEGDGSARVASSRLPQEFVPLARAFNAMAAQLSQRERELVATNDRLTVMASIDMLSGLANRRGFQSRLDFEWLKAQQYACELSLLMIDVDHFGSQRHLRPSEGDACLTRLGETLAGIAADTMGFAGRYGGEEFCLLLPNTSAASALQSARPCAGVQKSACRMRPRATRPSLRAACTLPTDSQRPGDSEAADALLYAAAPRRNTWSSMVREAGRRSRHGAGELAVFEPPQPAARSCSAHSPSRRLRPVFLAR